MGNNNGSRRSSSSSYSMDTTPVIDLNIRVGENVYPSSKTMLVDRSDVFEVEYFINPVKNVTV